MNRRTNAVRVGSSDPNRLAELKANHEELQKMLANGWQITEVKKVEKPRRPRIQKEKTPRKVEVSVMNGLIKVIVDFTEWQSHGSVGTITRKIY